MGIIPLTSSLFGLCIKHDSLRARKLIQVTNILETRAREMPNLNTISCSGRPTRNENRVRSKQLSDDKPGFLPDFFFEKFDNFFQ